MLCFTGVFVLLCDRTDLLKMTDVKEQVIYIKFCFHLSKMVAETRKLLKEVFTDNVLSF
jgi:hypothetical protein